MPGTLWAVLLDRRSSGGRLNGDGERIGMAPPLTRKHLNRTLLARQGLLARRQGTVMGTLQELVGLQGQDVNSPYIALWNRLEQFDHDDLQRLLEDREAVRAMMMRGTQHILLTSDYLRHQASFAPILRRQQRSFLRQMPNVDISELLSYATELLRSEKHTRPSLAAALHERWPAAKGPALARTVQHLLPIVHPPPDGLWGVRVPTPLVLADQWYSSPADEDPDIARLICRYLAAFGPATLADIRAWSGLTGLAAIVDQLRDGLTIHRDDQGRELYDVFDGQIQDPDTPAPPRLMAWYDNAVQGFEDRTRIVADEHRSCASSEPTVLLDGFVAGKWKMTRRRQQKVMRLEVILFRSPSRAERSALETEIEKLSSFAKDDGETVDINLVSP